MRVRKVSVISHAYTCVQHPGTRTRMNAADSALLRREADDIAHPVSFIPGIKLYYEAAPAGCVTQLGQ